MEQGLTRNTLKHAAVYGSSAVLGKLLGFVMLPIYAQLFGTEGYGVIAMIDASLKLAGSVLAFGLAGAIIRIYHQEAAEQKRTVVSTGVILVGAGAAVIVLAGVASSFPISMLLLGDGSHWVLVCLAFGAFSLDLTGDAAAAYLVTGAGRSRTHSSICFAWYSVSPSTYTSS